MRSEKYAKYLTLMGAHFVNAPLGFGWIFGNLSAYMESYFMCYCYPGCVDGDSQWILTLFLASGSPGLFFATPLIKRVGIKWAGIFAMIVCAVGLLTSSWTVGVSVIATAVFMGLINGMGAGVAVCAGFTFVKAYAGKHTGVFLATTISAPTILAIAQNQIITAYVNPKNLKADKRIGPKAYFSESEMLDRVPEVIFIIGAMTLGLQAFGYLLVSSPPPPAIPVKTQLDSQGGKVQDTEHQDHSQAHCDGNTSHSANGNGLNPKSTLITSSTESLTYKSNVCCQDDFAKTLSEQSHEMHSNSSAVRPSIDASMEHSADINSSNCSCLSPFKPLETLRTRPFQVSWLYSLAMAYSFVLKNTYYKQFGLLYINNDRYLTLIGSLIPVVASSARVIFGGLMDKGIISLQDSMCISLSVNAVLFTFWYFVPQVSAIGYMFLVLGLAGIHSLVYTILAAGTLHICGEEHFTSNFNMLYSSETVGAILSALIVSKLLDTVGWFWLFASCSIVSLCVLSLTVLTDFSKTKKV
ncbi:oxalate:formate antiporter [Plakobranchus ocellatus]|uniref:Oxalate:formate antiporter n=1 Tax=Plakobranchus ocellatus TaxID=259542 RepID=A0AAV4D920_9GAST|nr:oxalate:formate antiporter [Plakobranchus ocellatus]